jgi:hypothetical protein
VVVAFVSAFGYEWRYSDDMQEHISSVNRDLQTAKLEDIGGEIISTHDHVHTLRDQVLAWKIKKAIEQSVTVGDAIQNALAKWPESI